MGTERLTSHSFSKPPEIQTGERNNHFYRYIHSSITPEIIGVLSQPRKTFEEIETLAEDIANHGLIHPLLLARFNEESCQRYLDTLNSVWKTNHRLENLHKVIENEENIYYILIAGERRFRAHRYLIEKGCQSCQDTFGPGGCFDRHFPNGQIEVRLCFNISAESALDLQFSENTHMRVPPHEEAKAYNNYWKYIKKVRPEYTLAQFSRKVGRSPTTLRNALEFCELPNDIQEYVEKGSVPYGIACEIARLKHNVDICDDDLKWWALRAITHGYKVPEFRDLVNKHIHNQNSGQTTMMEIFACEETKAARRSHLKKTVAAEVVNAVHCWNYYLKEVLRLYENGELNPEDSPFSLRSPVHVLEVFLARQEDLVPHLKKLLPKKELDKAGRVIPLLKEMLPEIKAQLPEEAPVEILDD